MNAEPYVQIVGADCAQCTRRIVSLVDGAACSECASAVHVEDACWHTHWESQHAGAATYRGAGAAPPPPRPAAPPDRPDQGRRGHGHHAHGGELLCTACRHRVFAITTLTFTGFPRFVCPDCVATVLHPLSGGRKTFYIVAVAISVAVSLYFLVQGQLAFPGLLAVWAGVALFQNQGIVRKLEMAEAAEPAFAEPAPKKKKKKKAKPQPAPEAVAP